MWRNSPPILLPYQATWFRDSARVKVCEKSRRIGISWADAAISALDAATAHCDTYYVGYNREMSEQYIEDVGFWAKAYQLAAYEREVIEDEDEAILVYRVRFASGRKVVALSSRPSNLRAKKGKIVIDEAAFHNDLAELRKAAMAILGWGGQVRVISTHDGVDNDFNKLCLDIRAGKLDYSLHRYDLDTAVRDGLYRRICLVNGWRWTQRGEQGWRDQLWDDYGVGASEELGCVPLDIKGGGKVFKREWFKVVDRTPDHVRHWVRFWDMAATAADVNAAACYTASVRMARDGDDYYIAAVDFEQLGPAEGDDWLVATAIRDGRQTAVRWEIEGGSAGLKVASNLKRRLSRFDADGVKPRGDKVTRALPFASAIKRGQVYLVRGAWNDDYIDKLYAFDGTAKTPTNDITDASSGAFEALQAVKRNTLVDALKRAGQI